MKHKMSTRRSMMSGMGAAAAVAALGLRTAGAQTPARGFSQPATSRTPGWMASQARRTFIDAATVNSAGEGMLYANNLYEADQPGYALQERDVAVVVCLRHFATVFAYDDAIWAKYGKTLSTMLQFTDPKTKLAPATNLLKSVDYGMALPNLGNTISSVVKRGTQFAVCDMATHFFARQLAMASGENPDAVYKELLANTIPNSHMVAAGVVAVNRAQEYGYTLLTAL